MQGTISSTTNARSASAPQLLDVLGRKRKGSGMDPIPDRLRAARHLAQFRSTAALADALGNQQGLSSFQLAAFERGDRVPRPAYVNEIADVCGVDPAWLYGAPDAESPAGDPDLEARVAELERRLYDLGEMLSEVRKQNDLAGKIARALKTAG